MTRLLGGLLAISLTVNIVLGQRWRMQLQDHAEVLTLVQQLNDHLQQQTERLATAAALLERNSDLQAQAQAVLASIQTLAGQRAQHYERLEHENPAVQAWGVVPLPADVVRLRERPAFVSAAAYREWLSEADTVPAAGEPSQAEPRPATPD